MTKHSTRNFFHILFTKICLPIGQWARSPLKRELLNSLLWAEHLLKSASRIDSLVCSIISVNDAKTILYKLYKEYSDRSKHGFTKSDSKDFNNAEDIQKKFFPELLLEDVEDSLRELGRNDFLNNLYADNTVYDCRLSDYAIATMENLPKENFNSITETTSQSFAIKSSAVGFQALQLFFGTPLSITTNMHASYVLDGLIEPYRASLTCIVDVL